MQFSTRVKYVLKESFLAMTKSNVNLYYKAIKKYD